jgi:hypothetical protein
LKRAWHTRHGTADFPITNLRAWLLGEERFRLHALGPGSWLLQMRVDDLLRVAGAGGRAAAAVAAGVRPGVNHSAGGWEPVLRRTLNVAWPPAGGRAACVKQWLAAWILRLPYAHGGGPGGGARAVSVQARAVKRASADDACCQLLAWWRSDEQCAFPRTISPFCGCGEGEACAHGDPLAALLAGDGLLQLCMEAGRGYVDLWYKRLG